MQLSYSAEMQVALNGMLADLGCKNTMSYAGEEVLNPGEIVVLGTNPEKQVKVCDDVANAVGIVMFEHKEAKCCDCAGYYEIGYTVPVLTKGRIWVAVDEEAGEIEAGTPAKYDIENKVFSSAGEEVEGMVFRSAIHDGMAVVEIL